MADHVRDVYRPIIERAAQAGFFPLTLHVSGPLLEWLEDHDTAWLDMIGRPPPPGRLGLLPPRFHEPIPPAPPPPHPPPPNGPGRGDPPRPFPAPRARAWRP